MIIPSCIGLVGGSGMNDDTLEKSASGVRGNYDSDDVDDDVDDEEENYDLCSAFGISDYGSYENDDDDDDDHDGNYNDIDNGINVDDDACDDYGNSDSDDYDGDSGGGEHNNMEDDDSNEASNYLNWMLIVFFRLQHRFNISNVAATAVLSFISMILAIISHPLRKFFPKTLKSAIHIVYAGTKGGP